ncbi:MAG: acyl-CoA dehydrogenase domain-containing protein, partial [Pseudomonadota bacterium]
LEGICDNLDNRPAAALLRLLVLPPGSRVSPPGDRLGSDVARALLEDREERERLTADIHVPEEAEPGLGALERALDEAVDALAVERRLRDAVRAGRLDKAPGLALAQAGLDAGEITSMEYDQIAAADACRDEVVQVDSFTQRQYSRLRG